MKDTITVHSFIKRFELLRPDSFSHEGLTHLFAYLEDMEDEIGIEREFDAIEICGYYTELPKNEHFEAYDNKDDAQDMICADFKSDSGMDVVIVREG